MFSFIIAPPEAPQLAAPQPPPLEPAPARLDRIDEQLLELLRDAGACPVWCLLNAAADAQAPRDRAAGRLLRLQLWRRLKRLRKLGLAFSVGRNRLSATRPDPTTRRQAGTRRRPTVAKSRPKHAVSAGEPSPQPEPRCRDDVPQNKVVGGNPALNTSVQVPDETKCASDPALITRAARTLARLPRNQPRLLTGWLHGEHCSRGRLLVLQDGEVAPLMWCCRGRVLLRNYRDLEITDYLHWAGRREWEVRLHKHPAAVALGRLKRGVIERHSVLKIAAARRNGRLPPRPGRRRGRPRTETTPWP